MHWPPLTETRSLSATGTPSSGWSASSAAGPARRGGGQASVGGVGLGEGALAVDRQPGIEGAVAASAASSAGVSLARAQLAGAQAAAISWAWRRVGSVIGGSPVAWRSGERHSPPRMAGTTMKSPCALGAFARSASSTGSDGVDDVVAQDVLELDRLGGRRDVLGVELGQLGVLVEDVVELALEPGQLVVGQPEPGQMGDMGDVVARQGGHGADDSRHDRRRWPRTRTIRPMGPTTSSQRDVMIGGGWGDRRRFLRSPDHPGCVRSWPRSTGGSRDRASPRSTARSAGSG